MTKYLLRTELEIKAFRNRYAEGIKKFAPQYLVWFNSLPIFQWSMLRVTKQNAEFIIGLLCILYIDGKINITFSSDCAQIMHNPLTDEEMEPFLPHPQEQETSNTQENGTTEK